VPDVVVRPAHAACTAGRRRYRARARLLLNVTLPRRITRGRLPAVIAAVINASLRDVHCALRCCWVCIALLLPYLRAYHLP